jgi:class 3 adenylate cyclase
MSASVAGPRDTLLRHLGTRDKLLLALLVPIWLVCFGLQMGSALGPPRRAHVDLRADAAGGYPTVVDFYPGAGGDLRLGDRLVRVGAADLRGVGNLGLYVRYAAESEGHRLPVVIYQRGDQRGETTLPDMPWDGPPLAWIRLVSAGFFLVALVLFLRGPPTLLVRSMSQALLLYAIHFTLPVTGGVGLNYLGVALAGAFASLAPPVALQAVLVFPSGRPRTGAWARFGPWLYAVHGPLYVNLFAGVPFSYPVGITLFQLENVAFFATLLVLIARAYRGTDAIGRRQIRWVVFGFYAALAPTATLMGLELLDRMLFGGWVRFYPWVIPSIGFVVLIPISILFAIVRYNLFDVDRLLSGAASWNIVLVILVGAGLVMVPFVGELSSRLLGFDPRVGQVAAALVLAAIVVPAQQRLRPQLERAFFKQRYALDQGIAALVRMLSTCEDTRTLAERVGEELRRLLAPEACVVYARAGDVFAPVFAAGRAVPSAFETGSLLVATLSRRSEPLALSADGRRPDAAALGPFDRAALETLGAEVVVPVRRDETLLAFLCLGPKRSGDVYTSTDLSHLHLVAETVSGQLRRFDQEEMIREARGMQESLRRYVPGAIADQLASGADLAPALREVSVLFVDIRGFSGFAEPRGAEEIFSTLNRYTETVSEIVRRCGGTVVEFNGDGMMAVFGAPRDHPHKERAAVAAAREIFSAVEGLPLADAKDAEARLSVGLGIATGEAFVGSIRAADRMIWSAVGNTTNLAARLQGLTRELAAALVIDAATWNALGPERDDFVRHTAVEIRGRRQALDLHGLPLARERTAPPHSQA